MDHDSSDPKETTDNSKDPNFEHTTRAILILGILIVSGFIIYDVTRPSEQYVLFSVLNQDKELGNYPSRVAVGQKISFYFYVENHLSDQMEFNVKIYLGNNSSSINPKVGVINALFLGNYSKMVAEGQNWTSSQIDYQFQQVGSQFIGLELWQQQDGEWKYVENHTLVLRINVTAT
jgi:uncharacterized membrane protein